MSEVWLIGISGVASVRKGLKDALVDAPLYKLKGPTGVGSFKRDAPKSVGDTLKVIGEGSSNGFSGFEEVGNWSHFGGEDQAFPLFNDRFVTRKEGGALGKGAKEVAEALVDRGPERVVLVGLEDDRVEKLRGAKGKGTPPRNPSDPRRLFVSRSSGENDNG